MWPQQAIGDLRVKFLLEWVEKDSLVFLTQSLVPPWFTAMANCQVHSGVVGRVMEPKGLYFVLGITHLGGTTA